MNKDTFYQEAFRRNAGVVGDTTQAKLHSAHVAIAGLGGVGGIYATSLARLGVGNFTIADADVFEVVNMNRQAGASVTAVGKQKTVVTEQMIKDINPYANVRVFSAVTEENVEEFLRDADIVLDGIDFFNIEARRLLFRTARDQRIPALTAAPIGFGSALLVFDPQGMSFDDYFAFTDTMTEKEQLVSFAIGLSPSLLHRSYYAPKTLNLDTKQAPSCVGGTLACATWVVSEVHRIISGAPYEAAPVSFQFDPFVKKFKRAHLLGGNRNPIQRIKKWYFLRVLRTQAS